jgi:hypothetical protein
MDFTNHTSHNLSNKITHMKTVVVCYGEPCVLCFDFLFSLIVGQYGDDGHCDMEDSCSRSIAVLLDVSIK